ncbi:MAG: hypothetical protein AAF393_03105 [Pseudomonadota bacterium]
MPDALLITYAVLIFTTIWILGAFIWLIFDAAQTAGTHSARRTAITTTAIVLVWAAIGWSMGARFELQFPLVLVMAFIPISLGTALAIRPRMSELLSNIRIAPLIAVQVYRVAGGIFLYLYYTVGTLSWGFARNAGWGDVLTGVLALPVAWLVWRQSRFASAAVVAWCIIGIGDLILAPVSVRIFGADRLVEFPINTVPLFLGPPLGILLHVFVLRAWWLQRQRFSQTAFAAAE